MSAPSAGRLEAGKDVPAQKVNHEHDGVANLRCANGISLSGFAQMSKPNSHHGKRPRVEASFEARVDCAFVLEL